MATAAEAAAAAEAAVRWVQPRRRHSLHHAGADADASCVAAVGPPLLPRQPLKWLVLSAVAVAAV